MGSCARCERLRHAELPGFRRGPMHTGMPALRGEWTTAMVDALPDSSERYELVDGTLLVTPSPSERHQALIVELLRRIDPYVRGHRVGHTLCSPSDVQRADPGRNRLQPDVFVVRASTMPKPFRTNGLLLAIEVVSPGSAIIDYQRKREIYIGDGVPEYWVLNAEARNLSRWSTLEQPGEVLSDRMQWNPAGAPVPLVIDLNELFDDAAWAE